VTGRFRRTARHLLRWGTPPASRRRAAGPKPAMVGGIPPLAATSPPGKNKLEAEMWPAGQRQIRMSVGRGWLG
jgi:hypothetical protein